MAFASAFPHSSSDYANHLDEVRSYYIRNVERSSESVKQLVAITNVVGQSMMEYINTEDRRFERNYVGAGSEKQSLKVGKADEFDYNIKLNCDTSSWAWSGDSVVSSSGCRATHRDRCLTRNGKPPPPLGGRYWKLNKVTKDPVESMDSSLLIVGADQPLPPPRPGYTFVLANCVGGAGAAAVPWVDLCYGSDVTPFLVRRKLHKLMEQAIQRGKQSGFLTSTSILQLESYMDKKYGIIGPAIVVILFIVGVILVVLYSLCKLRPRLSGPALTFTITIPENEEISVDLVPFFDLPHLWPYGSNWPRKETKKWLPQTKIDKIKAKGVQLVPKKNFYWLISFNFVETELLDGIDTGTGCRKQSLRIVKHLSSTHWCKMTKPPVSSYLLKHLLFWECEKFPSDDHWSPDMLWKRVLGISTRLLKCLDEEKATHYFYPAINHLADKDRAQMQSIRKAVQNFIHNPSMFLNE